MSCFRLPDYLLREIESLISQFWWGDGKTRKIHWVKWDSLCESKRDGGMGFRDLKSFNLVLLGKQIWRIIFYPNSLLSRVCKAKYFPHTDVLQASPNSSASFTWKSICSALEVIRKGVCWRVGNGLNIDIWKDGWIPRDTCFTPITLNLKQHINMKVATLIDLSSGTWDEEIISEMFWNYDMEQILRISLPVSSGTDVRVWHFTQHGHFSVRSAYFLARDLKKSNLMNAAGGTSPMVMNWNWVWQIKTPNKIKVFLWRALRDNLPT